MSVSGTQVNGCESADWRSRRGWRRRTVGKLGLKVAAASEQRWKVDFSATNPLRRTVSENFRKFGC